MGSSRRHVSSGKYGPGQRLTYDSQSRRHSACAGPQRSRSLASSRSSRSIDPAMSAISSADATRGARGQSASASTDGWRPTARFALAHAASATSAGAARRTLTASTCLQTNRGSDPLAFRMRFSSDGVLTRTGQVRKGSPSAQRIGVQRRRPEGARSATGGLRPLQHLVGQRSLNGYPALRRISTSRASFAPSRSASFSRSKPV
jgi:hypothetical protein